MTTPSEGPGWQQGSWAESGDWLRNRPAQDQANLIAFASMTQEQQRNALGWADFHYTENRRANLERFADTDPLRDRIANTYRAAVARVHLSYDRTSQRISEAAQTLVTQAREYRDAAVQGVTNTYQGARDAAVQGVRDARDQAVQVGQQVAGAYNRGVDRATELAQQTGQQIAGAYNRGVDRATELGQQAVGAYQQGRDQVVDLAQRGQVRLDQAWQAGADRLNEAGQNLAQGARNTRDAVVGAGRDAVAAGRDAVGRAGRWFEGKFNNAMLKAEGSLASFNASRHDPTLQSTTLSSRDRLEMSERFSEAMRAPTLQARNEILQGLAQASQAQVDAQTQQAQQSAMHALSGVAPASQAVAAPAQPQTSGQGEQTKPDLTKNTDKGGLNR